MLSTIVLTSCEKDDDYLYEEDTEMSDIAKPIFDKDITTTTTSDVTFRARFNNGGDKKGRSAVYACYRQRLRHRCWGSGNGIQTPCHKQNKDGIRP